MIKYHEDVTSQEKQIITCIWEGKSYKNIAENLNISPHTVQNHVSNIHRKLRVKNKGELLQLAIKRNLISI